VLLEAAGGPYGAGAVKKISELSTRWWRVAMLNPYRTPSVFFGPITHRHPVGAWPPGAFNSQNLFL